MAPGGGLGAQSAPRGPGLQYAVWLGPVGLSRTGRLSAGGAGPMRALPAGRGQHRRSGRRGLAARLAASCTSGWVVVEFGRWLDAGAPAVAPALGLASRSRRRDRAWSAGRARWTARVRRIAALLARGAGPAGSRAFPRTAAAPPAPGRACCRHALAPPPCACRASRRIATVSPTFTSRAGLASSPLTCTRPLPISSAGQAARLVEARAPQPLVDAQSVHLASILRQRQPHVASRPTTRPWCDCPADRCRRAPHDFVADRQAQAGAAAHVAGREGLEQPLAQLGGRCRGRIAHGQRGQLAVGTHAHRQSAARRAVLDGVVQQVARELAQHPLVRRTGAGWRRDVEVEVLVGDQRRQVQRHLAHDLRPVGDRPSGCWRSCSTLASDSIWLASRWRGRPCR
jgi:hypothetical protein